MRWPMLFVQEAPVYNSTFWDRIYKCRLQRRIERAELLAEMEDRTRDVRAKREALEALVDEIAEMKRGRNDV